MRMTVASSLAATMLLGVVAAAQELDPRTYAPTPVGTMIMFNGIGHSEGAYVLDPSLGIEDVEADLTFSAGGAAYFFGLAGRQARVLGVFPYAWGDVAGE